MNCRILLVLALLLAWTPGSRAQSVSVTCDTRAGWIYVADTLDSEAMAAVLADSDGRRTEVIDAGDLVESNDVEEDARRTGSREVRHTCGPVTLVVRASWWNSNPMGEMGADQFATVELIHGNERVAGPLGIGACSTAGRQWERCPEDWATAVRFNWVASPNAALLTVSRKFEEVVFLNGAAGSNAGRTP